MFKILPLYNSDAVLTRHMELLQYLLIIASYFCQTLLHCIQLPAALPYGLYPAMFFGNDSLLLVASIVRYYRVLLRGVVATDHSCQCVMNMMIWSLSGTNCNSSTYPVGMEGWVGLNTTSTNNAPSYYSTAVLVEVEPTTSESLVWELTTRSLSHPVLYITYSQRSISGFVSDKRTLCVQYGVAGNVCKHAGARLPLTSYPVEKKC